MSELSNQTIRTEKNEELFLAALRKGKSIAAALLCAGKISRSAIYDWRNNDEEFRAKWDEAVEAGTDQLEDVAYARAVEQSDLLMIFMLKARRPERYRERASVELTGANGGPVKIEDATSIETARMVAFALAKGLAAIEAAKMIEHDLEES